jgi:CheY-like chemotaxis protein
VTRVTRDAVPALELRQQVRLDAAAVSARQRRVLDQLEDGARRTELLAALAGAGGLLPQRAANVLCSELGELETSAIEAGLDGLGAMARATRKVVEQLGGVKVARGRQREVVVLDDNEITRDLITLALQAEGHRVRSAATVSELSVLIGVRKPHVLLSEARLQDAPGEQFCGFLRVHMALEGIPIVIFSSARGDELEQLARDAGADRWLSKDQGISDLMGEVARLFEAIP